VNLDDPDPPVHRISRAEERERLVAEALAHAELQEAQYRLAPPEAPRDAWMLPVALMFLGMAGILSLTQPRWLTGDPLPSVTVDERERGLLAVLYLEAQQIEVFRLREGRLPASLDELPVQFPGIRFVRSNNRVYQLVAHRPEGGTLVYDSSHPATGVGAAPWTVDVP
jgi:hypothetical protein